jgi:hypothetical protein
MRGTERLGRTPWYVAAAVAVVGIVAGCACGPKLADVTAQRDALQDFIAACEQPEGLTIIRSDGRFVCRLFRATEI